MSSALALLRLLPVSDWDKDAEFLALGVAVEGPAFSGQLPIDLSLDPPMKVGPAGPRLQKVPSELEG